MLHFMQIEDRYLEELKLSIESNYAVCDGQKIYPVKGSLNYRYVVKKTSEANEIMLNSIGYCSLTNLDPINGHAELTVMVNDWTDKDVIKQLIIKQVLFCIDELRLQKVWTEVYESNSIKLIYEDLGFIAEGVRKEQKFIQGKYIDTIVLSILDKEIGSDWSHN